MLLTAAAATTSLVSDAAATVAVEVHGRPRAANNEEGDVTTEHCRGLMLLRCSMQRGHNMLVFTTGWSQCRRIFTSRKESAYQPTERCVKDSLTVARQEPHTSNSGQAVT